ncbi:MAG: hypothetical protein AAGI71_10460 [Bacteroidota bacterium]
MIRTFLLTLCLGLFALPLLPAHAQEAESAYQLLVEPEALTLNVGDQVQLTGRLVDANGMEQDVPVLFFSRGRRMVAVSREGLAEARAAGKLEVIAQAVVGTERIRVAIPTVVTPAPAERIVFVDPPTRLLTGTEVTIQLQALDARGAVRTDLAPTLQSENPAVATVDAFQTARGLQAGTVTLTAAAEGITSTLELPVVANPITRIEVDAGQADARTGDVLQFNATAFDAQGQAVSDAPITYAFTAQPADDLGNGATGQIEQDGRFVAETAGRYTILATTGSHTATATVNIAPRDVQGRIELIGHGLVSDVHTSDLWVWEGADGRDYAITGTWGGNGEAYFWDVTNPASPAIVDTFTVDARTVNDVKVSADGRVCAISREGASNRRNGLVLLDCTNPNDVQLLSTFDDELTGGVHNLFIYEDHIYALSAGQRYDIINIEDPTQPRRVGRFELEGPGQAIHDVWVMDGIAYSSNWHDGVVLVDVGNGVAGGSPSNPVQFAQYAYPSGWNHAAFPFYSPSTGKFYVIAGDEAFPYGLNRTGTPTIAAGWLHFIDFTDPDNPQEVARYQVPEAGTHNFWVDGETLYVAYYNGGLRVVDISGDLMGDLYKQGREMAWYLPHTPDGHIPNAPMVWGPQPHKGNVFFSDWNSGLWSVKFVGRQEIVEPESD